MTADCNGGGPVATPAGTAAVFFDLDRTLMEGSSAFQFGRAAFRVGLISRRQLVSDGLANLRFRLRGSTDQNSHALRDRISHSLAGTPVRDLERLGADVLAGVLPRVYPQMREVAYRHQDEGRKVYIVTAAARELAELLAEVLRFDGGIGSQFSAIEDGVFTGEPAGLFVYREEKAEAIRQLAAREGFDLSVCFAYSDSESDLPMLEAVGHPVVVNPDQALLRRARADGWDVLRFDRLGRRLRTGLLLGATALTSGAVAVVLARRTRPVRRRLRPRARAVRG